MVWNVPARSWKFCLRLWK
uniref:Uncharacterized protein n=1 Tax=Rhizophora mucronata TaxID=61149 RepID=A0A2P2PT37_RHIMU